MLRRVWVNLIPIITTSHNIFWDDRLLVEIFFLEIIYQHNFHVNNKIWSNHVRKWFIFTELICFVPALFVNFIIIIDNFSMHNTHRDGNGVVGRVEKHSLPPPRPSPPLPLPGAHRVNSFFFPWTTKFITVSNWCYCCCHSYRQP